MATPAVSVIIPTYNRLVLLREALDSVKAQTFRDCEVIVVDDGSTEPIAAAVEDHPTAPRIFRHSIPRGPAAARNRGIREARADMIAFLDSDDLWLPKKLERFMAELAADRDLQIMYGPMRPIDVHGRPVPGRTKPCVGGRITKDLFCSSFVHVPTVVCFKSLLMRHRGFDESLPVCEDYDLWLRISANEMFGLIEEPLASRRLHSNRLSKTDMCRNLSVKATVLERFYESKPGKAALDPAVAAARLSRAWYVAGRAMFKDGQYRKAWEYFQASRRHGGAGRSLPLSLISKTLVYIWDREPSGTAAVGEAVSTS